MPLYEFECSSCGFTFEYLMSVEDGDRIKECGGDCPNCNEKGTVQKKMSCGNFVINGYNEKNGYSKK